MTSAPLSRVRHILRAVATTVVPESASLDDRAWIELEGVVARMLADRGETVYRQVVALLRLLQVVAFARYGQPLTRLSPKRRTVFLESVARSRFALFRRGFWGLRTLIFMGYYTREDVTEAIGYRPHRDGWGARGGTVASVPFAPAVRVDP